MAGCRCCGSGWGGDLAVKAANPSPGSEVAQVFVGAVCGVLAAALAVLVWLWVEDRNPSPPVKVLTVTENYHPDNQLKV